MVKRSKNRYSLPIKKGDYSPVAGDKSPAHRGKLRNSVDFSCKEGTEILAAAVGEVVWIKDDSNVGGPNKKYWNEGNRIVIKHKNKEYSAYEHLKYRGVSVRVGDKVKERQLIGYSGNTGWSFGPHLHFEVFIFTGPNKENDFETLIPRFKIKYK